jgi:hypothetical protein
MWDNGVGRETMVDIIATFDTIVSFGCLTSVPDCRRNHRAMRRRVFGVDCVDWWLLCGRSCSLCSCSGSNEGSGLLSSGSFLYTSNPSSKEWHFLYGILSGERGRILRSHHDITLGDRDHISSPGFWGSLLFSFGASTNRG